MSNKRQLGMVIDDQARTVWQRLATDTRSFPVYGPTAGKGVGAISVLMERIADKPDLVGLIVEALNDD